MERLEDRALLAVTDVAGGSQPHENRQPFAVTTYAIALEGIFPPRSDDNNDPSAPFNAGGIEPYLGEIMIFGGNFAPRGWALCNGQILSIAQNTALFSILGTTYGGNGQTTFALPDLRGRTPIGAGVSSEGTKFELGQSSGSDFETLTIDEMPSHTHIFDGDPTSSVGGGQPHNNMMPTLALNPLIDQNGEVRWFAGNFAPVGSALANGQLLSVSANRPLFDNIGATYGGDGVTTFALPNLQGRVALDDGNGETAHALGEAIGQETVTLTTANLPAHVHTVPGEPATSITGGGQPHNNMQPSLALNYEIMLEGVYPSRNLALEGADAIDSSGETLDSAELNAALGNLVEEGIARWSAAGIDAAGIAKLRSASYEFGSLDAGVLASNNGPQLVTFDLDAAGLAWFVDATPTDDAEFGAFDPARGLLAATLEARSGIDLLTVVLHEQGHLLGFNHDVTPSNLMAGGLEVGVRRLPTGDETVGESTGEDTNLVAIAYDPFLAAIHIFAGPTSDVRGIASTSGQILPIAQNTALFSLIGTTYGGNGQTTFALPNFQGRVVLHTGLANDNLGELGGSETVTLIASEMPAHFHILPGVADVSITKTNGVSTVVTGSTITYTITVSNAGPDDAPGTIVTDNFPAILTNVSWTAVGAGGGTATAAGNGNINEAVNLPVGASVTFTVTATVSATATGTLANTATVTTAAVVNDPNPDNNDATDTDTLVRPRADLSITKTDGVTSAEPGSTITYTITVSNAGPNAVLGATVIDNFPAILTDVSWTAVGDGGGTATAAGSGNINDTVNLPAGASATYTVTATIGATATGTLSNTATVTAPATIDDPDLDNNSATDTDSIVLPIADLSITKTDGVTSAQPGTTITYTITVSNAGPDEALGVTVTDNFPAILTNVTWTAVGAGGGTATAAGNGNINDTANLPAGASVTYTVTATVSATATPGTLSNTATVTAPANIDDPDLDNNSATDTDSIVLPIADLSITKTDGVTSVEPGTTITYTITVSNAGPDEALGVTVTDNFPAILTNVTWTAVGAGGGTATAAGNGNINDTANLPAGASVTYTVTATVSATATSTLTLSNTATVTAPANIDDPNLDNNSATDTDSIFTESNVGVTKTDGVTTVIAGQTVTYTIVVSNAGPATATNASLIDNFPAGLSNATWTSLAAGGASGNSASGSGNISQTLTLPPGSSVTYTVTATISSAATGSLVNTATVSHANDITPGNNSATDTDTLLGSGAAGTVPDPAKPGKNILIVNGTALDDKIAVAPSGSNLVVTLGGRKIGTFLTSTISAIVIYGQGGNDNIKVDAKVTQPAELFGNGGNDTLYGGSGIDTLHGGDENDTLFGGKGNDTLHGDAGNDSLYGQDGNDTCYGDAGIDKIWGEGGADTMYGGTEGDFLYGGAGNDTAYGEQGDDTLFGDGENDTLDGGVGNDSLSGGTGDDLLRGGDNDDKLSGDAGNDSLDGGAGSDSLNGGANNDLLRGGTGNDTLLGGAGNDILLGEEGLDNLSGDGDKDILIGGIEADTLNGGAGDDLVVHGATTHDANDAALKLLLSEWGSSRTYALRIANIRGGTGPVLSASGTRLRPGIEALEDGAADILKGSTNTDWFLTGVGDTTPDRVAAEQIN